MKRFVSIILIAVLCLALFSGCARPDPLGNTAEYLIEAVGEPGLGAPGGEWTVIALSEAGQLPDAWREGYLAALSAELSANGGMLGSTKTTEYARGVFALRELGENPSDFGGCNFLSYLENPDAAARQGPTGLAFSMLALDSDASEQLLADYTGRLLEYRLPDGGFAPKDETEIDADITAITIRALLTAGRSANSEEIVSAVSALSAAQNSDGSFSRMEIPTAESTAQVILALCELGISPDKDARFVKNSSVSAALRSFHIAGSGFAHERGGKVNLMASEQALMALAAEKNVSENLTCSIVIRCDEVLDNMDLLDSAKHSIIPENGIIYENPAAVYTEGETAYDLLNRELRSNKIHAEFSRALATGGVYIEGIANLYEFDCGETSGWFYSVNGKSPPYACSEHKIAIGDELVFEFVTTMRSLG